MNSSKDYTYNQRIENRINAVIDDALQSHSKILPIRVDLRYPLDYGEDNPSDISSLMTKIQVKYKRKGVDLQYIWAREKNLSEHYHYHCVLLIDGNKKLKAYPIVQTIMSFWQSTIHSDCDGLVHYCNSNDDPYSSGKLSMIRRNSPTYSENVNTLKKRAMYLAKDYSKDKNTGVRNFGCSSITKKEKNNG